VYDKSEDAVTPAARPGRTVEGWERAWTERSEVIVCMFQVGEASHCRLSHGWLGKTESTIRLHVRASALSWQNPSIVRIVGSMGFPARSVYKRWGSFNIVGLHV
jgi:hypothetical protein